jgi:large subunit ribosomal protein L18
MGKRDKRKIQGSFEKPRLSVFRSNQHIYAQVIDDLSSQTLVQCSTLDAEVKSQLTITNNMSASKLVGEVLGRRLLEKSIQKVVFDRKSKPYHGRVKALAEGARFVGVQF